MIEKPYFNKFSDLPLQDAQLAHRMLRDSYEMVSGSIDRDKNALFYILIIYIGFIGFLLKGKPIDLGTPNSEKQVFGVISIFFLMLCASICLNLFVNVKKAAYCIKEGKLLEKTPVLSELQIFFSLGLENWSLSSFSILLMPAFLLVAVSVSIWVFIGFSISIWIGIFIVSCVIMAVSSFFIWYKKWCAKYLKIYHPLPKLF